MLPNRTNVLAALLVGAGLLSTAAWTAAQPNPGAGADRAAAVHSRSSNERQLVAYWWNDGSCHGYPDVMQIYAVEYDGSGAVVAWMNAGSTSGTDSCSQYHDSAYYQAAYDWCQCPVGVTGPVLGNPSGSTTEHP